MSLYVIDGWELAGKAALGEATEEISSYCHLRQTPQAMGEIPVFCKEQFSQHESTRRLDETLEAPVERYPEKFRSS